MFDNENGESKSLQDSLSFVMKPSQDSYSTPIKNLQHSYQETTALLSISFSTPIKTLKHFYRIQDTHQQNDRILEFYFPMYVSRPIWGYRDNKRWVLVQFTTFRPFLLCTNAVDVN